MPSLAKRNSPDLAAARPDTSSALDDRARECWRTLQAIADRAGGELPARARAASLKLSGPERNAASDSSASLRLLTDLYSIAEERQWAKRGVERVPTATVLPVLWERGESGWLHFQKGDRLNENGLARLLKKYEVTPKQWREGKAFIRGYMLADFVEPWARYVRGSRDTPEDPTHPTQPHNPTTPRSGHMQPCSGVSGVSGCTGTGEEDNVHAVPNEPDEPGPDDIESDVATESSYHAALDDQAMTDAIAAWRAAPHAGPPPDWNADEAANDQGGHAATPSQRVTRGQRSPGFRLTRRPDDDEPEPGHGGPRDMSAPELLRLARSGVRSSAARRTSPARRPQPLLEPGGGVLCRWHRWLFWA